MASSEDGNVLRQFIVDPISNLRYRLIPFLVIPIIHPIDPDEFDSSISLWVDEPKGIKRTTKWAEDFELERRWPPTPGLLIPERSTVGVGASALREHGIDVAFPGDDDCA